MVAGPLPGLSRNPLQPLGRPLASLIQLPFLIAGSLWGGVLGDRLNRRTLLVSNSFILAILSAGLAFQTRNWPHAPLRDP